MKIEGKIEKSGPWWAVSTPLLLVFSQGRTKKSAKGDKVGFQRFYFQARSIHIPADQVVENSILYLNQLSIDARYNNIDLALIETILTDF